MEEVIDYYMLRNPNIQINKTLFESGGMKNVYMAKDTKNSIEYVLKIIEINDSNSEKRTRRELDILKSYDSNYFPRIYDVVDYENENRRFIIILEQFIKGINLRNYISTQLYSSNKAIHISLELIKALKIIHTRGLVHRDVKPENIMITDTNAIVLLDFGIARDLTDSSITSDLSPYGPMSIGYAAPEQIKNNKKLISIRTDFFAWAVVFFELLNGYNPLKLNCTNNSEVLQQTLKVNELDIRANIEDDELSNLISKNLKREVHLRSNSDDDIIKILEDKI